LTFHHDERLWLQSGAPGSYMMGPNMSMKSRNQYIFKLYVIRYAWIYFLYFSPSRKAQSSRSTLIL
jgi:hypothetical protein